jgi:hypothetical protein
LREEVFLEFATAEGEKGSWFVPLGEERFGGAGLGGQDGRDAALVLVESVALEFEV